MSLGMQNYLIFVGVFILLVWAFYVPFKAGLLYNGPIYCMAIGGYFAAFAVRDLNWPFGLAVLVAVVLGGLLGLLPALGFTRTSGVVTAIASMSLIFIIQSVIRNLKFLGGANGLWSIPKIDHLLLITYGIVIVVGVLIYRLDQSRIGKALEAVSIDPDLASSMGVNTRWISVLALTISSLLGALAGAIYAFNLRILLPEAFGFALMLSSSTMLFIGGRYTMWGALITVPILWGLPQWVPSQIAQFSNIIYGVLLVVTLVLWPEGIVTRDALRRVKSVFLKIVKSPA